LSYFQSLAPGELQHLQRVVVLGVDHQVGRLVAATIDAAQAGEAGVHGLAELGDHDQVVQRNRLAATLGQFDGGLVAAHGGDLHRVAVLVGAADHLGAAAHRVFWQSYPLGQVRLEHQPERALGAHLVDLAAQLGAQRCIADLVQQHIQLVSHQAPAPSRRAS